MIAFAYGSQSYFDQLLKDGEIEAGSLYFINDTQSIYRGHELIARTSVKFVNEIPEPYQVIPDTIYVVKNHLDDDSISVTLMVSEGHTLIPISSPGEGGMSIDSNTLFMMLQKLTSKDVLDGKLNNETIANDKKLITAGAVRQALEWESF